MTAFVLDASVAISWCFPGDPTENNDYSRRMLALLETCDAVVPEVWPLEVANNIFVSFNKRKRINERQVHEYMELLEALPIRIEPYNIWATVALQSMSRRLNLAAYDVAYLNLAARLNLPLATFDKGLRKAAIAEGIKLLP